MIQKLRKNIFNNSNYYGHKSICWILLFSFLLISISILIPERYHRFSENNETIFITVLNQISSEININERSSRVKNFENSGYSLDRISLNLFKTDYYFNQSEIINHLNSLNLLLTSSPNNHSFRGPPIII